MELKQQQTRIHAWKYQKKSTFHGEATTTRSRIGLGTRALRLCVDSPMQPCLEHAYIQVSCQSKTFPLSRSTLWRSSLVDSTDYPALAKQQSSPPLVSANEQFTAILNMNHCGNQ